MKKLFFIVYLMVLVGLIGEHSMAGESNLFEEFKGVKWLENASWFQSNNDFQEADSNHASFDVFIKKDEDLTFDGEKLLKIEYWVNRKTQRFESINIHYKDSKSFSKFVDWFKKILGDQSLIFKDIYTDPQIKSYIWEKEQPIHVRVNEQYPWVTYGNIVIKYSGK